MSQFDVIMNAFQPASALDDPERFAGRREQVKELSEKIHAKSTVPMVYGQRGLGKSSLAMQIMRIAQGDATLLRELDLEYLELPDSKKYTTLYVTCAESTKGLDGLIQLIINAMEGMRFEGELRGDPDNLRLVDKTTKNVVSGKFFSRESEKHYQQFLQVRETSNLSPQERMVHEAQQLIDLTGQPLLVIIDEFDLLQPKNGISGLLKACSNEYLKFMPVGIASTQAELLQDHISLGRQLQPVKVPLMSTSELEDIVERTEGYLNENGIYIRFTEEASERLAHYASGFPWFVHVIGQKALSTAYESQSERVNAPQIDSAVSALSDGPMAQQYQDLYQRAVGESANREIVLRLFSLWPQEDIPTREVYSLAGNLDLSGPSAYLGQLVKSKHGSILRKSPSHGRALYRFNDEMFKAYVRMRSSIFPQVDSRVRTSVREARWGGVAK